MIKIEVEVDPEVLDRALKAKVTTLQQEVRELKNQLKRAQDTMNIFTNDFWAEM